MEIQGYGVVEARPTFAHVGYLSIGTDAYLNRYEVRVAHNPTAGLAVLVTGVAVLLVSSRQWRGAGLRRRVLMVVLGCGLVVGGITGAVVSRKGHLQSVVELTPEAAETLSLLERLVVEIDGYMKADGSWPSRQHWARATAAWGGSDAWGNPLAYQTFIDAQEDGRHYRISSRADLRPKSWSDDLTSTGLGPDGRFQTQDDLYPLNELAYPLVEYPPVAASAERE